VQIVTYNINFILYSTKRVQGTLHNKTDNTKLAKTKQTGIQK